MNNPNEYRTIRLRLTDMAYGGDAVGRDPESGMAVFVRGGIEGEEVDARITSSSKNMLRGMVVGLNEASPVRVDPSFPDLEAWGGIPWQHISYEAQLSFKHKILGSQLSRLGSVADVASVLQQPIASPAQYHYRNTSHFAIDAAARSLAYHKQGSHSLIPIQSCPVSNDGINRLIPFVNETLSGSAADVPADSGPEGKGIMQVWKVTVRSSEVTDHSVIVFHTLAGGRAQTRQRNQRRPIRKEVPAGQDVASMANDDPEAAPTLSITRRAVRRAIAALSRTRVDDRAPAVLAVEVMDDGTINPLGETRGAGSASSEAVADMLTGASLRTPISEANEPQNPPLGSWIEKLVNRTYWVGPEAFFQTNSPAAELLIAEVGKSLPAKSKMLVDAHAGAGTFALQYAGRAAQVVGFETEGNSVESGKWSAHAAGIKNIEYRKGRAEELLPKLDAKEKPDAIILDPPRGGCHPTLLAEIGRRLIPTVVYVSCDPSTLARDVKVLSATHRLKSARVIDMFPQTYHIETIAIFEVAD